MSVRTDAEPEWQPRAGVGVGVAVGTAAPGGTRLRAVLQVGHAHVAAPTGGTIMPSNDPDPLHWNKPNDNNSRALRVYVQDPNLKTFSKRAFVYTFVNGKLHDDFYDTLVDNLHNYVNNKPDNPYTLVHMGADYDIGNEDNVVAERLPSLENSLRKWYPVLKSGARKVQKLLEQGQMNQMPPAITVLRDSSRSVLVQFRIELPDKSIKDDLYKTFYLFRGPDDNFKLYKTEKQSLITLLNNMTKNNLVKKNQLMTIGFKRDRQNFSDAIAFREPNKDWELTNEDLEKVVNYLEDAANAGNRYPRINFYKEIR